MTFAHVKLKNFKKEDKVVAELEVESMEDGAEDTKEGILPSPASTASESFPPHVTATGGNNAPPSHANSTSEVKKEIKSEVIEDGNGSSKYFNPYGAY